MAWRSKLIIFPIHSLFERFYTLQTISYVDIATFYFRIF